MIYEPGNAAKQWILEDLDKNYGLNPIRILDLGCGNGRIWRRFLETHSSVQVVGLDTDILAIKAGRKNYANNPQMNLRVSDAQLPITEEFDLVVALSAVEHVVDRPAFLKTVWSALKKGGRAYLNYDVGHFRSRDLKERLMVPISQLLAKFGFEGSYMKRVEDKIFEAQAQQQGFTIETIRKHNLYPMKGFMRGASEFALNSWFDFEEKLNAAYTNEELDKIMWSTTLIVKKS